MDELYDGYRVLYVEQKEIVKERLIAAVVDSLDSLSDVVCAQLLSIAESYRHLNAITATQANQELIQAQNIVQEAGRVYGQQLASTLTLGLNSLNILKAATASSVVFKQPIADISISDAAEQVNASTNQSNDANEDSDDEEMSIKSEINSEDECLSDSDSQPDVDVKKEADETQTETEINQTTDTATVKDEIVSSSECSSDSDSDDYESDSMQVKEEEDDEIRFVHNSNNPDFVPYGASIEESENIAQSNGNAETVNSYESNHEHQSHEMLMGDEENINEESLYEPTITVVNYEVEMQSIANSNNQDSAPDSSFVEESENISQQDGIVDTVGSHMMDSNESNNEHSSGQEVLDGEENNTEANSEPGHAGPSIVSNTSSTLTRRSARASAKKGNHSETTENSLSNQRGTLQSIIRQSKRKTGHSGKSNTPKRLRVEPAPTVAADDMDGETEEGNDSESEAISFRVIVRRLKCRVPGCKKLFPGKVQLDGHLLTKHSIEKYACKVKDCTESYATRGELTTHRDTAHDNLDNDWPCGQCEVTCSTYQNLCTHTWNYHEYGLFACFADKCNFTEKTRIKVYNHQFKHQPAKHRCTYAGCTWAFKLKSDLTRHSRVHSKEKPFLCSQCPKAFANKSDLTVHERVHSGLKPYSCTWPHCDFSGSVRSNAISHIRSVHFGLPETKKKQRERGIIDNRDARLFLKKTITTAGN